MSDDLYDRQRRLPGIGDAGQSAIERSSARLPSGPSAGVALAYLVRAGVGSVAILHEATSLDQLSGQRPATSSEQLSGQRPATSSEQLSGQRPATSSEQLSGPSFPHLHGFRFSAPLELARGAHLALSHLIHSLRTQ
jgi:hypothetical protein